MTTLGESIRTHADESHTAAHARQNSKKNKNQRLCYCWLPVQHTSSHANMSAVGCDVADTASDDKAVK